MTRSKAIRWEGHARTGEKGKTADPRRISSIHASYPQIKKIYNQMGGFPEKHK